jgi:hypothetical protein
MPDAQLPAVVYHYTSMDTMMKIVETKAIWCTAISYLNDTSEREFLLSEVRTRLPSLMEEDSTIEKDFHLHSMPVQDVNNITELADEQFVTSFSTLSDSLMHWRSYCPQQSGVAIGFKTECLKEAMIDEPPMTGMVVPPVEFGTVRYIRPGDKPQLDELIRSCVATAKKLQAQNSSSSPSTLNDYFQWTIEATACGSKHSSFEVESEYRLVLFSARWRENNIRFRPVRSSLVPYIAMHIPCLSRIGSKEGP